MKKVNTIISGIIFERQAGIEKLRDVLSYCDEQKWIIEITPTSLSINFREDIDLETAAMFHHIIKLLDLSRGILWNVMFYKENQTTQLLL